MNAAALALCLTLGLASPPTDPIADLGSDDYATRETAAVRLRARGWEGRHALQKAMQSGDAEVSSAARRILQDVTLAKIESLKPLPMIDAAWYDVAAHHYDCDCGAYQKLGPYLESIGFDRMPYANYRRASELMVAEWLVADVPPWQIDLRLNYLHAVDACWARDCMLNSPRLFELAVKPWQRKLFAEWLAKRIAERGTFDPRP